MANYLLDTHVFYWLITGDKRLNKNLRQDILYPSGHDCYHISHFVLLEIMQLKGLKKISLEIGVKGLFEWLQTHNIEIDFIDSKVYFQLDSLPMQTINNTLHSDPFDRIMIAHAIKYRYTMISHDMKFPFYRKFGLHLLEV